MRDYLTIIIVPLALCAELVFHFYLFQFLLFFATFVAGTKQTQMATEQSKSESH